MLLTIILLTGCSVNYELTIKKDNINENIILISENEKDNFYFENVNRPFEAFINSPIDDENYTKLPGVEYYDINKTKENGYYKAIVDYTFNRDDFINSSIINSAVSSLEINYNNDQIEFYAGNKIKAFESYNGIDTLNIKINVSDDYEIVSTNANENENNIMTWNINKDNYTHSSIRFTLLDKSKKNDEINDKNNLFIALGMFLLFILVLIIFLNIIKNVRKSKLEG